MNAQEIFDYVVMHLATQKQQALGRIGCAYRNREGLQCAAGCLIPDELYDSSMENEAFCTNFIAKYGLPKWMFSNRYLLTDLQMMHDCAANWSNTGAMRKRMREIAKTYNLDDKVVLEFRLDRV